MLKYLSILLLSTLAAGQGIPNLHRVDSRIYRSGLLDSNNISTVKSYGIKSIISLKTNADEVMFERLWALENGVQFINIPIQIMDYSEYTKNKFFDVYHMMRTMPPPVLVHCTYGSDRTGVAIGLWRIFENTWPLRSTLHEMDYYGFNPLFSVWKYFLSEVYYGSSYDTDDHCNCGANCYRFGKRTDTCYYPSY